MCTADPVLLRGPGPRKRGWLQPAFPTSPIHPRPRTQGPGGFVIKEGCLGLSVAFLFISLLLSPQWRVRRIYWNYITETLAARPSKPPQAPLGHQHSDEDGDRIKLGSADTKHFPDVSSSHWRGDPTQGHHHPV